MIAKISRGRDGRSGGRGFGGVVRYVLGERPELEERSQPRIIGGNLSGRDAPSLTRELGAVRAQRPEVERPVQHISLSFDTRDRVLSDTEMARIAERYLERNGFDLERSQYLIVRHHDKDYAHCHVVANRVRIDGSLTRRPGWEYRHSAEQCRALEKEFSLHAPRERTPERAHDHAPTRGEDRMRLDRGLASEKEQLRRLIREAAQGRPTMSEFVRRLGEKRVQVRPNLGRTGDPTGLSYRLEGVAVQGRKLGPAYSWTGVQTHLGVRYEARRDRPDLARAAQATSGREPERGRPSRTSRGADPLSTLRRMRSLVGAPAAALRREALSRLTGALPGREVATAVRTARDLVELARRPTVSRAAETALRIAARVDPRAAILAKVVSLTRPLQDIPEPER